MVYRGKKSIVSSINGKKPERETNQMRLLTLGNKLRVVEREVGGTMG